MNTPRVFLTCLLTLELLNGSLSVAQDLKSVAGALTPLAASAPTAVPSLVPYVGVAIAGDGKLLTGETGVTFQIFKDEAGGEALWTETQTVAIDSTGHYKVQLGATSPNGLPAGLFATGAARWLEVQIAGEPMQPRVLLASVPYALKAADAATLGGLPASAFALAGAKTAAVADGPGLTPDLASDVTTGGGIAGYLPEFSSASMVADSPVFVSGSNVGIGTTTPSQTLDVNGTAVFRNTLYVYHNGTATPSGGVNSVPIVLLAEGYNSSTKGLVAPAFQWKAEVVGNNTASPSASLNLIYSNGTTTGETGLYFNPNGTIHFAPAQTFPATSASGVAIDGTSASGVGVEGASTSGSGVLGTAQAPGEGSAGVLGTTGSSHSGTFGSIGISAGVWGDAGNSASGVLGTADNAFAGFFLNNTSSNSGTPAVLAQNEGDGPGVAATSGSDGIYGVVGSSSATGKAADFLTGIWADTGGETESTAFLATADSEWGGLFFNNSSSFQTLFAQNDTASGSSSIVFEAEGSRFGGICKIDVSGNLTCSGKVASVAAVDNGARKVETYAVQSAENWLEDFGSGRLSEGAARINLEPTYAQTVNAGVEYHVFLTPKGDCKGLYVTNESAGGFDVRELGGGKSAVAFDYRIVAKRAGYESVRLADVTDRMRLEEEQRAQMGHPPDGVRHAHPAFSVPRKLSPPAPPRTIAKTPPAKMVESKE
jgi:hypothetical protein